MESEILIGVLVRLLPAIAVCGLAFVAAADRSTRERWGNVLYQIGSIRPDQRDDAKVGKSLKWPFFIVALGLLLWPVQYFTHATRRIDATTTDLKAQTASPTSDLKKSPTATSNSTTSNSTGTSQPGTVSSTPAASTPPASDLKPATQTNPSGSPVGNPQPAPQSDLKPAPAAPPS